MSSIDIEISPNGAIAEKSIQVLYLLNQDTAANL